jgi:hypothetical protein
MVCIYISPLVWDAVEQVVEELMAKHRELMKVRGSHVDCLDSLLTFSRRMGCWTSLGRCQSRQLLEVVMN